MGCLKLRYRSEAEIPTLRDQPQERVIGRNALFLEKGLEKKGDALKNRVKAYRYGFNGMEKDDEVKGSGNSLDFGARVYDPRLARFLSVDPLCRNFPYVSSYAYAGNNPVQNIDVNGEFKFPAANNYPNLAKYLENNIKEILSSPQIMRALLKYSDGYLTPDRVEEHLEYNEGPEVRLTRFEHFPGKPPRGWTPGHGINGMFEYFYINENIAKELEQILDSDASDEDKQAAMLNAVAVILHEYTHYGDVYEDGERMEKPWINPETGKPFRNVETGEILTEPMEGGEEFEKEVYGKIIMNIKDARNVVSDKTETEPEVLPSVPN